PLEPSTAFERPYGSGREVVCYVMFLVAFVIVTVYNQGTMSTFYYTDTIRRAIVETPFSSSVGTLAQVQTALPLANNNNNAVPPAAQSPPLTFDTMQTIPDVQDEYVNLISYCFGPLSAATESSRGFGPVQNSLNVSHVSAGVFAKSFFGPSPTYNDLMQCIQSCAVSVGSLYGLDKAQYAAEYTNECSLSCTCFYSDGGNANCKVASATAPPSLQYMYTWTEAVADTIDGLLGPIPGSGYVVDLPANGTNAQNILQTLRANHFLDVATRAVVIEFAVFNPYLQLFDMVTGVVEFPPTGGTVATMRSSVLNVYGYGPSTGAKVFFEVALALAVTCYAGEILVQVYRRPVMEYLSSSGWTQLHGVNIALFITVITLRLVAINAVYGNNNTATINLNTAAPTDLFRYLTSLAKMKDLERSINAVNATLMWLGLLKYTQVRGTTQFQSPFILFPIERIAGYRQAMADLLSCVVLFFICLVGYAQAGFLAFSTTAPSFRTFGQSVVSVLEALTFRLDYAELVHANAAIAPVYFVSFYIVLVLVVVNIFVAILQDAFTTVHKQQTALKTKQPAVRFPFATGVWPTVVFYIKRQWV
ncbi:hypothetical protein AaE_001035, partial [Aphanomyces astaci]